MTEYQKKAEALISGQQKGLDQYQPAFMAGEQLKDIARREPESAELLAQDLEKSGMGIRDAEKQIAAEARKHRNGNAACVPPWIAEDILRKFYGLRERSWGPGEADSSASRADVGIRPYGAQNDGTGDEDAEALREKLDDAEKRVTMALDELDEYRMDSIEAKKRASAAEEQLREAERLKTAFKAASDVAEKKAQEAAVRAGQLEKDLREARKAEKDAMVALKEARENPNVPEEVLAKLREEAEAAAVKAHEAEYGELDTAKKKYLEAEAAASKAKAELEAANKGMEALKAEKEAAEKALRMAAPEMAVFKERFERVQKDLMTLIRSIDHLPEDKRSGAWRAMAALIEIAKSESAGIQEESE